MYIGEIRDNLNDTAFNLYYGDGEIIPGMIGLESHHIGEVSTKEVVKVVYELYGNDPRYEIVDII